MFFLLAGVTGHQNGRRRNKRLATGSNDNTAKVWDGPSGLELLALRGHKDSVTSLAAMMQSAKSALWGGLWALSRF